jgi:hypothetical protein
VIYCFYIHVPGTYGVPPDVVASVMISELSTYLANIRRGESKLKEVYLVSNNDNMTSELMCNITDTNKYWLNSAGAATAANNNDKHKHHDEDKNDDDYDEIDGAKNHSQQPADSDDDSDSQLGACGGSSSRHMNSKDNRIVAMSNEATGRNTATGETCPICLDVIGPSEKTKLDKCGHALCKDCWRKSKEMNPVCPVCRTVYGIVKGDQPRDAGMNVHYEKRLSLPGYEPCGTIIIEYSIPPGVQMVCHCYH